MILKKENAIKKYGPGPTINKSLPYFSNIVNKILMQEPSIFNYF